MKKYKSSAKIKLSFRSINLDLHFISELLNLSPKTFEKIGDSYYNYGFAKTNLWQYEYVECNAYEELDDGIKKILNYLLNKDFLKIRNNNEIHEKLISIIIKKEKYDDVGIDLSIEDLDKLQILGFGLSISVYDL